MLQPRRFHGRFLFLIPLTPSVLLITLLDATKNIVYLVNVIPNLNPNVPILDDSGTVVGSKSRDTAYMVAQYLYTAWLLLMVAKAGVGFWGCWKSHRRAMGYYLLFLGLDCLLQFVKTTLAAVFNDMSDLSSAQLLKYYALNYLLLFFQWYCFICCWMHLKWVNMEFPAESMQHHGITVAMPTMANVVSTSAASPPSPSPSPSLTPLTTISTTTSQSPRATITTIAGSSGTSPLV